MTKSIGNWVYGLFCRSRKSYRKFREWFTGNITKNGNLTVIFTNVYGSFYKKW